MPILLALLKIEWGKVGEEVWKNLAIAVLGPLAAYLGALAKAWIDRTSTRATQANLCEEAGRLIQFHKTLAEASVPTPSVQDAQTAVVSQLNRVLERLSQSLMEPVGSSSSPNSLRSAAIVRLENWLLLYRPLGILSGLLHLLFYLMIPLWCLILVIDFDPAMGGIGSRVAIPVVFAIPMVLCNYLAHRVDAWTRRRRAKLQSI